MYILEKIGERTIVLSDRNKDEPSKIEIAIQCNSAEARADALQAERDTLAAQLATARENIATLALLVRLTYGNRDSDVNKILESVGQGWQK